MSLVNSILHPRINDGGSESYELLSAAEVDARIAAVTLAGADLGDLGATETIDLANGQVQYGALTAACAIALPAPGAAQQYLRLVLTQDDTGGFLPQFYAVDGTPIEWVGLGCQAPSLDTIPNAPFATAVFSFDIGEDRIIGRLENPHLPNIIATPALITDPREIDESLVMWMDAADRSTMVNGTGIAAWLDKSGYNHSFSQATGSTQPTTGTLSNGKPALVFTASKYMNSPHHADFTNEDFTVFVAFERDVDPGTSQLILGKGTASNLDLNWNINVSSGDTFNATVSVNGTNATGGRGWNSVSNTANTPYIYEVRLDDANDVAVSRVNGANESSGAFASPRFKNSGAFGIGTSAMSIAEILIFNTVLSSTKRDAIVAYLSAKWGI